MIEIMFSEPLFEIFAYSYHLVIGMHLSHHPQRLRSPLNCMPRSFVPLAIHHNFPNEMYKLTSFLLKIFLIINKCNLWQRTGGAERREREKHLSMIPMIRLSNLAFRDNFRGCQAERQQFTVCFIFPLSLFTHFYLAVEGLFILDDFHSFFLCLPQKVRSEGGRLACFKAMDKIQIFENVFHGNYVRFHGLSCALRRCLDALICIEIVIICSFQGENCIF